MRAPSTSDLPATMSALALTEHGVELVQRPVPRPRPGQVLVRLCARHRLPLVNVVRRAEQADALRALGAEHVVVSSAAGAGDELRALCERLGVRFAFDAVAGEATLMLARALGKGGRILVF